MDEESDSGSDSDSGPDLECLGGSDESSREFESEAGAGSTALRRRDTTLLGLKFKL
jgi:hypothetical protein